MVQRVSTVAFEGIEARAVDVQVQVAGIAGVPCRGARRQGSVGGAGARRSALIASGLALPARRIIVNLAPTDLPKESSHYDLPIALGLMAAIGAIPPDALAGFTVLGELGLDGSIAPVAGVLPAAIGANTREEGLICPAACGAEAAWASPDIQIIAANSLIQIANHFKGTQVRSRPQPKVRTAEASARHQGPGERQARAGNRRGRRTSPPDDGIQISSIVMASGAISSKRVLFGAFRGSPNLSD
jgi:magnesium chelatase family protein